MSIRVAFIDQAGAKPGGAEESLTLLLRHLPADIQPAAIVFEDGEFADRLRGLGIPTRVITVPQSLRAVTREKPSSSAASAIPSVIAQIAQALREAPVDLVHTNTMKAHLFGAPAARLRGIPTVLHVRDIVGGLGRTALQAVAATCSRERIAISTALASWYGLGRTTVVANPVELAQYAVVPDKRESRAALGIELDERPLIGIVGRINRWKGHDRFLRIAAAVNAKTPIRCAIIGEARFRDADFVPELHELAANLGIADRTTFVPWLADPRVAYAALDLHANCSEREPFGRSIVEAAASGVPTVAFDDGGAVDIIRDGVDGALVAAGDESAFISAALLLVSDPAVRASFGAAARAGSFRFAAAEHATRVAAILRRSAA